jgi:hypothetical protein
MIADLASQARPIDEALERPNGARFYRCALQVNPYSYLIDNNRSDRWGSEASYNRALVDALRTCSVEVIAVADHHRIGESKTLIELAEQDGIAAFPGFEAETKDGVHMLCIFERNTDVALIDSYLAECGIHQRGKREPCKYDVGDLLELVERYRGIAVAPHVLSEKGLLKALPSGARMNAWRFEKLVAAAIPGPVDGAPANYRKILENTNPEYHRNRAVALINCNDVSAPEDISDPSTTTRIKMSHVSLEALRQAFLDPTSRIKLNSEAAPEERMELVALAFEGGFLDGVRIHFNPDLNVFIGGRGTGKSTIIESLRYALGAKALGADAQAAHDKIIRNVVGSGSKISLLIETHRPDRRRYVIERTAPNAPIVRDDTGDIVNVAPLQLLSGTELFGQHEITEVTRSATALTELLGRFAEADPSLLAEREAALRRLEESRNAIIRTERDSRALSEKLAHLPTIRDTLKLYQQAGVEERLKDQSILVREEQVFRVFEDRLRPLDDVIKTIDESIPIDDAFLTEFALKEFPNRDLLARLHPLLENLESEIRKARSIIESAFTKSRADARVPYDEWFKKKSEVQGQYEKTLRDLHKSKIDGEEFIRLRRQIEELTPLAANEQKLTQLRERQDAERAKLVANWEDLLGKEFRRLDAAAKQVSKRLGGRLRISVKYSANHEPLLAHLRGLQFRNPETPSRKDGAAFSLRDFAESMRGSAEEIGKKYRYSATQAEKLAGAGLDWRLQLDELALPATTDIELNIGLSGHDEWRSLDDLSTGQKATAVLLLLLIDSEAPLIVDQPEDDLDNRFISESVVGRIRDAKGRRQFIFATHNANIPVLGDAELIAGLKAVGEASGRGHAELEDRFVGSIDKPEVAIFAEEILEGGKTAFVMRKEKYGF